MESNAEPYFAEHFPMGVLIILCSSLMFKVIDLSLNSIGKSQRFPALQIPQQNRKSWFRFKNAALSFIHSLISAVWALACFYIHPKLAEDMIATSSPMSVALVSFSIGYFIHDVHHLSTNPTSKKSVEFIAHHCVVILCFGISVWLNRYIAYSVVALLVEVNSVFLHMRQLLLLAACARDRLLYRSNSLVNLGTFILFRITTLGWMTRWLVVNRANVPVLIYTIGSLGMATITVMNIILFYRVLQSDFLTRKSLKNE